MSRATVGDPPPDGVSETFVIAQEIMRLASSPWSPPTPESLEIALATYNVAMRLQSAPPVYEKNVSDDMRRIQQQLAVISAELQVTKEELRRTREETGRSLLQLNEQIGRLLEHRHGQDGGSNDAPDVERAEVEESTSPLHETVTLPNATSTIGVDTSATAPDLLLETLPASNPIGDSQAGQVESDAESPALHDERIDIEPAPPQASEERWTPTSVGRNRQAPDRTSAEGVEKKLTGLLNKATTENSDSVSSQIASFVNNSPTDKRGETLLLVISLIFEKATDEPQWAGMYARLCTKLAERTSPGVWDGESKNRAGEPIVGGQLVLKYLLNTCQRNFQAGWFGADAAPDGSQQPEWGSDEYYVQVKAKRQGLGLIQFIGELFKEGMVRERIIHECIKKLLPDVNNAKEVEVESLCKLLITVGSRIDTAESRTYMDMYFDRIKSIAESDNTGSRTRYMILDIIELRQRNWVPKSSGAGMPASGSRPFGASTVGVGPRADMISVLGRRSSQQQGHYGRMQWLD